MRLRSISARLAFASACALPVFLGLTGLAIERSFAQALREAEREKLAVHGYLVLGAAELEGQTLRLPPALPEPRFGQLGSGLYARVRDEAGRDHWRSPSAALLELPPDVPGLALGECVLVDVDIEGTPAFQSQCALEWEDAAGNALPFRLTIWHDQTAWRAQVATFRARLVRFMAVAALVLLGVQLAVLRFGLRPLGRLVGDLRAIEVGEQSRLEGEYPSEVEGVTTSLNQLLAAEEGRRRRYRDTLADLAHSLKTPLAVLRTALDTDTPEPELRAETSEQVERMGEIVTHQLARAGTSGGLVLGKRCAVAPVAERLAAAIGKIHAADGVRIEVDTPTDLAVRADEPELMEMLGNLVDNACKHGGGRVSVRAARDGDVVVIEVTDEGPGIPAELRQAILERGTRADESTPGQGIGLADTANIARSLGGALEVHDGSGPPPRSGARFTLSLLAG